LFDATLLFLKPLLATAFTLWSSPVTWLEILAFGLSVLMVLCNLRVDPLGWPLAIASSLLYALLFLDSKLYGEAGLQVFFVVVALWGWWQWRRGRDEQGAALVVHRLTVRARWGFAASLLAAWPLAGWLLGRCTDSEVPFLDALATVASIGGQILLGRKLVENWLVWLGVNLFSIGLFAFKSLWLTTLLYAVFAALSVLGWRTWRTRIEHGPA
jgi:nicotinamide mononucleotide transporter